MVKAINGDIFAVKTCNGRVGHHPSSAYWTSWEGEREFYCREWDIYGLCVYASFYNGNLSEYDLAEYYEGYIEGDGKWLKFTKSSVPKVDQSFRKRFSNPIFSLEI